MNKRNVEVIVAAPDPHYVGDGFRVHNFIPSTLYLDLKRLDPFVMLDYQSKFHFEATDMPRGVGPHPHRGFETVTIVYKGKVAHRDNHGGGGVIGEGEVQWMTAASGVLHEEFHEAEWAKNGGDFHVIQLWINLPQKYKMSAPKYQSLTKDRIKKYKLDGGEIEVIAGEYKSIKGPATTFSPVHLMNAKLEEGAKVSFNFPENYNTAMLVVQGKIQVNNEDKVSSDYLILMDNEGEDFEIQALHEETIVFVMSGKPLKEPIYAQGPFVMNNQEEVSQAYRDYHRGKFGQLKVE